MSFSTKTFFLTGIRIFLGIIFFTAGMGKLFEGMFPGLIGPPWLEQALAEYGLGFYARFIAYSQVIVGLMLLTRRFATIGAVMLFPMILNIWIVTISLQWRGTPYVNFFLLCLNIILLISDYDRLKFLLVEEKLDLPPLKLKRNIKLDIMWAAGVILILVSTLVFPLNLTLAYITVAAGFIIFIFSAFLVRRKKKEAVY